MVSKKNHSQDDFDLPLSSAKNPLMKKLQQPNRSKDDSHLK